MTVFVGLHEWWAETSLLFVLTAGVGAIGSSVFACAPGCLRYREIRMILREARAGSRVVRITRRGTAVSTCVVDVGTRSVERRSQNGQHSRSGPPEGQPERADLSPEQER